MEVQEKQQEPEKEMATSFDARLAATAARFKCIETSIEELRSKIQFAMTGALKKTNSTKTLSETNATLVPGKHRDPSDLKELQPCTRDTAEVAALRAWCLAQGLHSARFTWVPSDYYKQSLQWRRDILKAPTIQHLCKSIVMENTHCTETGCSKRENSRYYIIVYPYTEKFDSGLVEQHVKSLNTGLGKKKFHFRLAEPEESLKLTGFGHGAVAPFGTKETIPVIMSNCITELSPPVFWMGGGHVDCKVCVDVEEFVRVIDPIVAAFTAPLSAEELEKLVD